MSEENTSTIKIFLLEDSQERVNQFVDRIEEVFDKFDLYTAYNAHNGLRLLNNNTFNLIFLDHDLETQTSNPSPDNRGTTVTDWIAQNADKVKKNLKYPIFIHSMNPQGANTMYKTLSRAGILSHKVPALWVEHKFNQYLDFEEKGYRNRDIT